jgi:F-type H+-transporting ATPase subunit alpha
MRKASAHVRLDYAQFLELEMFTRFGGLSDARVKARITRGERIRAVLTQPRFAALRLVDQVALLAALADGVFDPLPAEVIEGIRERVAAYLDAHASDSVAAIPQDSLAGRWMSAALVSVVRTSPRKLRRPSAKGELYERKSEVEDASERFNSWRR